jgi:hypothetical protein
MQAVMVAKHVSIASSRGVGNDDAQGVRKSKNSAALLCGKCQQSGMTACECSCR